MKTSEFIKRVEELGYEVEGDVSRIMVERDNIVVSVVYKNKVNTLDTKWNECVSDELFDLCVEYAKTPLQDREEKKFRVKCKITDLYLHHERLTTFDWVFGVDEKGYFTLKELEGLGIDIEHYDLEEIE